MTRPDEEPDEPMSPRPREREDGSVVGEVARNEAHFGCARHFVAGRILHNHDRFTSVGLRIEQFGQQRRIQALREINSKCCAPGRTRCP